MTLEIHEVANIFPMMNEEEYARHKEDIRKNGQIEPIWTHQGKIIDGRNRYKACQELGITPVTREWTGTGSLVMFVVGLNLHRRHLDSGQRAVVGLEIEKALGAEARERQAHGMTAPGQTLFQKIEKASPIHAAEQAAALVGSNRQYINDAKKIAERAPDVLEAVRAGSINIPDAKRVAALPEGIRADALKKLTQPSKKPKESRKARDEIEKIIRDAKKQVPEPPRALSLLPVPDTVRLEVADACKMPLEDGTVNLILTSPPYGLDIEYDTYIDPSESWYEFMQQWLHEAYRVAAPGAWLVVNVPLDTSKPSPRPTYSQLVRAATLEQWEYRWSIVWHEGNVTRLPVRFMGTPDKRHLFAPVEMIAAFRKGDREDRPTVEADLTWEELNQWAYGVWDFNGEGRGWEGHPAAFPEELPHRLVKLLTYPGDTVLDPFAGSGTTILTAWRLGRYAIGFDVSEKYVESAHRRITQAA